MEYLIRDEDSADVSWPAVHQDRLSAVLTPEGWDAVQVDGDGDFAMTVDGLLVEFYGEMAGWQVVIQDDMEPDRADALMEVIAGQIALETGRRC